MACRNEFWVDSQVSFKLMVIKMFTEKRILDVPRISVFTDVLTDEESNYIINKYSGSAMNPRAGIESRQQTYGQITEEVEQRSISWDTSDEDRNLFKNRLSKVVGIPISHIEAGDIYMYEPGQEFGLHHDFPYVPKKVPYYAKGGDRVATAIFWLNDDYEGGELDFPLLEVRVSPVKNGLIYFEYGYEDETLNMSTWHKALRVHNGPKWIAGIFCASGPRVE
jgi:prolyl 4-hydroxylase